MTSLLDGVQVLPTGDAGVVLQLGTSIDEAVHGRVLSLAAGIAALGADGVEEVVPSYRSVLVRLDPLRTTPAELVAALGQQPSAMQPDDARPSVGVTHTVDVACGSSDALDLEEFAQLTGQSSAAVLERLDGLLLRVYMFGFAPGFAYLGGVPAALAPPRRRSVRAPVPAGSLIVAAGQAAFCPVSMPTGWYVLGRTTQPLFDAQADPPVPFAPGDRVRLVVR